MPCEVLAVFDSVDDTTQPHLEKLADEDSRVVPTLNTGPAGPAHALRFGFECARAPVVVVTMADGCDDPMQIEDLVRLVERGVVIAAASRYTHGGQQVGGPVLKGLMSQHGRAHPLLVRSGRHPRRHQLVQGLRPRVRAVEVGIEADAGFEIGIELVAKARRHRRPVAEISTIWLDRGDGPVQLPTIGLGPEVPPLVLLRLRQETFMSTVLISGSAGFIGGYVVAGAADGGPHRHRRRQPLEVRQGHAQSYDDDPNYRLVEGDVQDTALMTELLIGVRPLHRRRGDDRRHLLLPHLRVRPAGHQRAHHRRRRATRPSPRPARAGCRRSPT